MAERAHGAARPTALGREAVRAHLIAELLPLWERHGLDRVHGGFVSRLDSALRPVVDGSKRALVHTRHVYSFARGAELGFAPGRAAAEHGLEFLRARFWDARHGGWFTTTDDAGAALDRRKDLYGHAFAIFALAHARRVFGDADALALARETLELVRARLRDPRGGGYFDSADETWRVERTPRGQNAHMHLVEALLALHEVAPDAGAVAEARALVELLAARWLDPSGAIGEHFDAEWRPAAGERGRIAEPGHSFEWTWLLDRLAELDPDSGARERAERVFAFARQHGVDADGGVFDQLDRAGRPLLVTKRLWPQTERVKALASRARATGDSSLRRELDAALAHCFARYVDPKTRGWREQLDRDGAVLSDSQNATSVYHVVFALSEALPLLS